MVRRSRITTLQFLNKQCQSEQTGTKSSLICTVASVSEPLPKHRANGMARGEPVQLLFHLQPDTSTLDLTMPWLMPFSHQSAPLFSQ